MNFLELTNDVCQRMGEVELTETDFADVIGAHAQIKQAVNAALSSANTRSSEWPFNYSSQTLTLTPYVNNYPTPNNSPKVAFESFRVFGDNLQLTSLGKMDYEEYIAKYPFTATHPNRYSGIPRYVYARPDGGIGFYPAPDKAYVVEYDYYQVPVRLVNPLDEAIFPDTFREAIVNGAVAYAYMFRGDPESAYTLRKMFQEDLKNLRTLYQNRYEYVRSGQIVRK